MATYKIEVCGARFAVVSTEAGYDVYLRDHHLADVATQDAAMDTINDYVINTLRIPIDARRFENLSAMAREFERDRRAD